MSGGEAIGRVRLAQAVPVGHEHALPLAPEDGGVQVHIVGGAPIPVVETEEPVETIYETAGPGELFSIIPAAARPASLTTLYAHLLSTAAAPRWIQIHKGQVEPPPGAKPYLVGDAITPIGGNTQWVPNDDGVERDPGESNGYVVVLSTTQDQYLTAGFPELTTVALGRPT